MTVEAAMQRMEAETQLRNLEATRAAHLAFQWHLQHHLHFHFARSRLKLLPPVVFFEPPEPEKEELQKRITASYYNEFKL